MAQDAGSGIAVGVLWNVTVIRLGRWVLGSLISMASGSKPKSSVWLSGMSNVGIGPPELFRTEADRNTVDVAVKSILERRTRTRRRQSG
jgi:hypothetical protein